MRQAAKPFENRRNRNIFVIGPIREEGSSTRQRSDDILEYLVKPAALACGFNEPMRADRLAEPGLITDQVIQHLIEDDLVIADLHEHNPNVFYELGVRHTTGKPCILLAEKGDSIPFDVHSIRTILFNHNEVRSWEKAKEALIGTINFIGQNPGPIENGVTMAFEILKLRRNQGLIDVFSLMEPMREARRLVREAIAKGRKWNNLKEEELRQIDELCRRFDLLGVYDRLGIVNSLHVDLIYAVPLVELYEGFLKDYVEHLRTKVRGMKHFWELVQLYERVREVPHNHPAETGEPDWPTNPRVPRKVTGNRKRSKGTNKIK